MNIVSEMFKLHVTKLHIVSSLALGVTGILFPNLRYVVCQTAACIGSVSLIDKFCKWFSWKYPDYASTNYYLSIFESLAKITLVGYASDQFEVLSNAHGVGAIGFTHWIAGHLCGISRMITYVSYVSTTIVWIIVMIICPLIGQKLRPLMPIITDFVAAMQSNRSFNVTYNGLNLVHSGAQPTLNEKSLEELCPLRCPSLGNSRRDNSDEYTTPENCSICTEAYSEKQLTRTLPCKHSFHAYCIDPWLLQSSSVCPICRKDVLTQQ
jgi:hypothetical protein